MRKTWLALVFVMCFIFPMPVYAQTPTPPPGILEICYPEGKFHPVECARAVWDATGLGGVFTLALILLVGRLILTPSGKALQSWVENKVGERLRSFSAPTPFSEIQRHEAESEYLLDLEKSETLRQPDEIASHFDEYLNTLDTRENPLMLSEDKNFVDLESGLSIPTRIGLAVKVESEQSKSFAEQKTFNSLEEAMNYVDEQSGYPYPALALLGEPGAGKSTLLRKFARQIVQERIADKTKPLPIFVTLSAHKSGSPLTFLRQHWIKMLRFDGLEEALANGKVWLFLDGLNEMPREKFDMHKEDWRTFLGKYCSGNGNRALIASRIADYGEGVDVPRLVIHPMDDERIQNFLKKRTPEHAEILWDALKKDRDEGRGAIYELSKTPFWLVMISRLSGKDGLPRNRADLIDRFIQEWLNYERERREGRKPNRDQRDDFMKGMTQLAWTGLARSQNYTFRKAEANKLLEAHLTSLKADDVFGLARDCSLISEESNTLRFHHQLLQEYFAARELARQFLAGKNLNKLWKTQWRRWKFIQSKWDPLPPPPLTGWEEAVILAVGMLDSSQAERLTVRILEHNAPLAARCILESGVKIGEAVTERVRKRLQRDLENLRVRLPARLSAGNILAKLGDPRLLKQRNEIELTDEKKISFIAPAWIEIPAGNFQMGTTPAQSWLLKRQRVTVDSSEQPAHSVQVSAFKMARFPVTVAEYRCFMEAGGYQNDAYWQEEISLRWRNALSPFEESYQYQYIRTLRENKEAILKQVDLWVRQGRWSPAQAENMRDTLQNQDDDHLRKQWEENENEKRDSAGRVSRPWLWDNQKYTVDNQPVIGVNWYEARAYAAWLTEVLRKQNKILEQEEIRLPTETEWEKAARGTSGRLWTWGNLWNSSYANSLEGRVMQPVSVGAYPRNKSPYGVQDMIGNVYEWCLDWYNEEEYKERLGKEVKDPCKVEGGNARVLRGGSWDYPRDYARCSYRLRNVPGNFDFNFGFRLVCSPSFKTLHSDSLHSESLSP